MEESILSPESLWHKVAIDGSGTASPVSAIKPTACYTVVGPICNHGFLYFIKPKPISPQNDARVRQVLTTSVQQGVIFTPLNIH